MVRATGGTGWPEILCPLGIIPGMTDEDADGLSAGLQRVCDEIFPGSRPSGTRRLTGGHLTRMDAFRIAGAADGPALVLRRYRAEPFWREVMEGCERTLAFAAGHGLPVPRVVWSDPVGRLFGTPAMVLTLIPGAPLGNPPDPIGWAAQMGTVLSAIHSVPVGPEDLPHLPPPFEVAPMFLKRALEEPRPEITSHPLARLVLPALRRLAGRLVEARSVFVHGDFWPGQVIWRRGRLEGVVDWDFPRLDDPGVDLGYCRLDISLMAGPEAAASFLTAYTRAAGAPPALMPLWDLIAAFQAMERPGMWHREGFAGIGRPELHGEEVEERLAEFVDSVLRSLG